MNAWAPPSRAWSPQARVVAMAALVAITWRAANWPAGGEWLCMFPLFALAIGACHALVAAGIALAGRQGRRAAIEAALCALFVGAGALAVHLIAMADVSSPC